MARQVTITIDEDVLARVLTRCDEHQLEDFVAQAVIQRCEHEDRSTALDAYTSDFGQPWAAEMQALGRQRFAPGSR